MRLLQKSKKLLSWVLVLAGLVLCLFFIGNSIYDSYEVAYEAAPSALRYDSSKDAYYSRGFKYDSYKDYALSRMNPNPVCVLLVVPNVIAIVYALIRVLKEYHRVSSFINEQARLEEELEKAKLKELNNKD